MNNNQNKKQPDKITSFKQYFDNKKLSSANVSHLDELGGIENNDSVKFKEQILSNNFVSNNFTFIPAEAATSSKQNFSNISQTLFGGPHYSKALEPDYLAV